MQYDVDQYNLQNEKLTQIIQQHEGTTAQQTHANIDSELYAQAEAMEEAYLTRIGDLHAQIINWNSKTAYKEFRHRFPTFVVTFGVVRNDDGTAADAEPVAQQMQAKIRFANLKSFPVEISSLSHLVKRNEWEGLQMRFTKQKSQQGQEQEQSTVIRLEQLIKPDDFPEWPIKHHISINSQYGSWFVITEPASSILEHEEGAQNFAQIVQGFDVLQQFVESSDSNLIVQVLAAERVAS